VSIIHTAFELVRKLPQVSTIRTSPSFVKNKIFK